MAKEKSLNDSLYNRARRTSAGYYESKKDIAMYYYHRFYKKFSSFMNRRITEIAKIIKDDLQYDSFKRIYAEDFDGFICHTRKNEKAIQDMFLKDTFTKSALNGMKNGGIKFNDLLSAVNISRLYDSFEIGLKMIWLSRQEEMEAKIFTK